MAYSVQRVAGMNYEENPRDVVFLVSSEEEWMDANAVFDALIQKHRDEMRSRFDYWQRGGRQDKYFHGFDGPAYRENFVFKKEASWHIPSTLRLFDSSPASH